MPIKAVFHKYVMISAAKVKINLARDDCKSLSRWHSKKAPNNKSRKQWYFPITDKELEDILQIKLLDIYKC